MQEKLTFFLCILYYIIYKYIIYFFEHLGQKKTRKETKNVGIISIKYTFFIKKRQKTCVYQ